MQLDEGMSRSNNGNATAPGELEINDVPPPLPMPSHRRKVLLTIGLVVAVLDLCIMPITYFYSLTYGTNLSTRNVFIVITCLYCMMTFMAYGHRCFRLWWKGAGPRYGPVGWQGRWARLLEFTNVNLALVATIFEIEIVFGTWPDDPIIRLCAMTSATICYYFGLLFLITAFLTQFRYRLPFYMSSTPKGSFWRPALLAILEDSGAIEGRGELAWRQAVMTRYEASPLFRKMLLRLTWWWGVGFLVVGVITTVLIGVLEANIAFGVGWGLPYIFAAVFSVTTVYFVKSSLKEERIEWRNKSAGSGLERGYS